MEIVIGRTTGRRRDRQPENVMLLAAYCWRLRRKAVHKTESTEFTKAVIFVLQMLLCSTVTNNLNLSPQLHKSIHATFTLYFDLLGFLWLARCLINQRTTSHDASVATMTPTICRNGAVIYGSRNVSTSIYLQQLADSDSGRNYRP